MKLLLSLLAAAALTAGFYLNDDASAQVADRGADVDFSGKIVLVYFIEGCDDRTAALEDPRWVDISSRRYLVGTAPDGAGDEGNWTRGSDVGVAWDQVREFYSFSKEQFEAQVASRGGRQR